MTRTGLLRRAAGISFIALVACSLATPSLMAQGTGGPLTHQGLHQQNIYSAAARAFGGVTIGVRNEVGLMFQNPAALHSLNGIQFSVGGVRQTVDIGQRQQFAPVRYYPNLSLLLENMTHLIPDPDPSLFGFNPQDTVQRPFDDIGPTWSRTNEHNFPLQAMVAVPFAFDNFRLVAGIGAVEYSNLDHFYQNNNVLSPNVLSQRPIPVRRPTDDNPVAVDWSQTIRSREGSIRGYGAALAGEVPGINLTLGVSGMVLDGHTDDFEEDFARGRLIFFSNAFRAESTHGRIVRSGTSTYSGQEFTLSSILGGEYVTLGFAVKAPTTFTRSFSMEVLTDTTGTPASSTVTGEDRMQLPWRGTVGLSLTPRENLRLGIEYEFRPYSSATHTDATGIETSPWVSSSLFRIGGEYDPLPWLSLRGGMRGEADVFVPEGSPIEDDPVAYSIYSGGIGINYSGVRLNLTYEYSNRTYHDIWGSAISRNSDLRHTIVADVSYTIPWAR